VAGSGKGKSHLDRAVEQSRAEGGPEQALLPLLTHDAPAENPGAAGAPVVRRQGRPVGSINLRAERYAEVLRAELAQDPRYLTTGGDPLRAASRVAAIDVTDKETLDFYSELWGCPRLEVIKVWLVLNRDVQPYHHQQLPRAIILNPGAPGGERVLMELSEEDFRVISVDDGAAGREEGEDD
jgi:hypothetical protein